MTVLLIPLGLLLDSVGTLLLDLIYLRPGVPAIEQEFV